MCGGSTWDHAEWRPFSGIAPEPLAESDSSVEAEDALPAG
jgi:hypothetical protein